MKLKMAENSLFAILLRSPWWISLGIAVLVAVAARMLLPEKFAVPGMFGAAPFVVIAAMAGWRQFRAPSAGKVARTLEAVGEMSWPQFSEAIEAAFRRDGYAVTRVNGGKIDFELTREGRTTLVSCKRWKAASTGIEPLRELHAAQEAREAQESIYVATGEFTDNARRFATERRIRLLAGAPLAVLLA
jgi:restriction system protein